jgi:hypothetical protein
VPTLGETVRKIFIHMEKYRTERLDRIYQCHSKGPFGGALNSYLALSILFMGQQVYRRLANATLPERHLASKAWCRCLGL